MSVSILVIRSLDSLPTAANEKGGCKRMTEESRDYFYLYLN